MSTRTRSNIAFAALIGILLLINWSIWAKEQHLINGRIVYLELAPADPRSIMQGDFMRLRFKLANDVYRALSKSTEHRPLDHDVEAADGRVVVSIDDRSIATYKHLHQPESPQRFHNLSGDELYLRYRVRNGAVQFTTDAYFFQEGQEPLYRSARYGKFRANNDGELLLTALYDESLKRLGATR